MKIAVNKCYGGFNLNSKAQERLIELGISHYKDWKDIPKNSEEPYIVDNKEQNSVLGKYYDNFRNDEFRTHPLLIQMLEELGDSASEGTFGEVKLIEIPDNIDYEINDYDGIETIHEKHRSW